MKTYISKPADTQRSWYILDASEVSLGTLAVSAANLLIGKSKRGYSPHVDAGDFVIVINSDKLVVTGDKLNKKIYYRHSGYPGGLSQRTLSEAMAKDSAEVIEKAVRGMLPVNKLRPGRLSRLKVYADEQHNHAAQKPTVVSLKGVR